MNVPKFSADKNLPFYAIPVSNSKVNNDTSNPQAQEENCAQILPVIAITGGILISAAAALKKLFNR